MNDVDYFAEYIQKLNRECPIPDDSAGHAIASMLIGHRMGLYDRAVSQGDKALKLLAKTGNIPDAIPRAVQIIRSDALRMMPRQVTIKSQFDWEGKDPSHDDTRQIEDDDREYAFEDESVSLLALSLPEEKEEIRDAYMLDMALALLYGVAVCSSPMDEQAMEEHLHEYIVQRLGLYRE